MYKIYKELLIHVDEVSRPKDLQKHLRYVISILLNKKKYIILFWTFQNKYIIQLLLENVKCYFLKA